MWQYFAFKMWEKKVNYYFWLLLPWLPDVHVWSTGGRGRGRFGAEFHAAKHCLLCQSEPWVKVTIPNLNIYQTEFFPTWFAWRFDQMLYYWWPNLFFFKKRQAHLLFLFLSYTEWKQNTFLLKIMWQSTTIYCNSGYNRMKWYIPSRLSHIARAL